MISNVWSETKVKTKFLGPPLSCKFKNLALWYELVVVCLSLTKCIVSER